jgi:hypothetical protein
MLEQVIVKAAAARLADEVDGERLDGRVEAADAEVHDGAAGAVLLKVDRLRFPVAA